jgi:hypothetical protein
MRKLKERDELIKKCNMDSTEDCETVNEISTESYDDNDTKQPAYPMNDVFIQKNNKHIESELSTAIDSDGEYRSGLMLLELLRKAKAPLNLFEAIINWAIFSNINYNVKFDSSTKIKRDDVIKNATNRYNLHDMKPKLSKYELIKSKESLNVVHFPAHEAIISLLSDDILMNPDNLLEEIPIECDHYSDVNTGKTYKKGYDHYIKDPSKQKYLPIILFMDKTHTDTHGRLMLEPIMMTLAIFNRKTRLNPNAWRTLGYITDYTVDKNTSSEIKLQDYHNIIEIILEPLKNLQQHPIAWVFEGEIKQLICPILYVTGDTEGADKACCRYQTRGVINYLCRLCNIHKDDIDNPFFEKTKKTKMCDIIKLMEKGDKETMNGMCMHYVFNAFHEIDFCDYDGGNHQSFPPEILHTIQHGLYDYLIPSLFCQKRINEKATRKKRSIDEANNIYDPDDIITGKNRVFTDAELTKFETICRIYGKSLSHQSDRLLPQTNFFHHIHRSREKMDTKKLECYLSTSWCYILKKEVSLTRLSVRTDALHFFM